jgi:hypothetical protein
MKNRWTCPVSGHPNGRLPFSEQGPAETAYHGPKMMTNTQLYLSVGLPIIAILISLAIQLQSMNILRVSIDKRFDGLDKRIDGIDKRMDGFDNRMDRFEKRMERFEDMLTEM